MELISLEKAQVRACSSSVVKERDHRMDELEASVMKLSLEHSQKMVKPGLLKISPPLHLEGELTSSYPGILHGISPYSPRSDVLIKLWLLGSLMHTRAMEAML